MQGVAVPRQEQYPPPGRVMRSRSFEGLLASTTSLVSKMAPQVILYAYPESPFGQKLSLVLLFKQIPFSQVLVPRIPPRSALIDPLGITYRRIPVLAIGNDLYLECVSVSRLSPGARDLPLIRAHLLQHFAGRPRARACVSRTLARWKDLGTPDGERVLLVGPGDLPPRGLTAPVGPHDGQFYQGPERIQWCSHH